MHIITGILIHSTFCALNFTFPQADQILSLLPASHKKDKQASCVRYSSHTTTDRLLRFGLLKSCYLI